MIFPTLETLSFTTLFTKLQVSSIPSITVDVLSRSVPASVLWVAPPMLIVENVKSAAPMAVVGFARKVISCNWNYNDCAF